MNPRNLNETVALRLALARIVQLTTPPSELRVVSWTGEELHAGPELGEAEQWMAARLVRLCRSLGEQLMPWQESAVALRDGELHGEAIAFDRRVIYVSVRRGGARERGFRAQALVMEQRRREAMARTGEAS